MDGVQGRRISVKFTLSSLANITHPLIYNSEQPANDSDSKTQEFTTDITYSDYYDGSNYIGRFTDNFLRINKLSQIVIGHNHPYNGFRSFKDGKIWSLLSSTNYSSDNSTGTYMNY